MLTARQQLADTHYEPAEGGRVSCSTPAFNQKGGSAMPNAILANIDEHIRQLQADLEYWEQLRALI
jgi:hypothetical protein